MNGRDDGLVPAALEDGLAGLHTIAPATLLPRTLIAVGLADGYVVQDSPIGPVIVAFNGQGVSAVTAAMEPEAFEDRFRHEFGRRAYPASTLPPQLRRAVASRLAGDRRTRIPLDLRGLTEFERAVLDKAQEIPRGEVRPYSWIAAEIGHPKAVRAVGSALGHNPIPLIIPCHRVVRADGTIGQYSLGGMSTKRAVLSAEGIDLDRLEELARAGVRYIGSDTTGIFCLPTCHNARRITDRHRVAFRSLRETAGAGYRACRECRPASATAAA